MKNGFIALAVFIGIGSSESLSQGTEHLPTAAERWNLLTQADEPSFRRHVIPLLSRAGCSSRECHGAFSGQGGFQLSLFGYDFDRDHEELTTDADGGEAEVRVKPDEPEQSLLLLKPTLQVKHRGKQRIEKESWEYNLLLKWIGRGARNDVAETGEFGRLEVDPAEILFERPGQIVQLRVLAHWKDGSVEDVTALSRFRSNDESVSVVSSTGQVECKEKGDTHIVVFYDNGVVPIPVMLPVTQDHGENYPEIAARTKVDELVIANLRKLGIQPSELCTDTEFLRRLSLDLTGTLPTPEEIEAFVADSAPGKRAKKIDELLETPAYAAWWTTKLCDYTGNNSRALNNAGGVVRNVGAESSRHWYRWIYKRVEQNVPYDEIVAGIVLATSRSTPEQTYEAFVKEMAGYFRKEEPADFAEHPTLPYYWQRRTVQKPEEKALAFAHSFLGIRIDCAQCHKHPFDQWTKTDFEQFQAFFAAVSYRARPPQQGEEITYRSLTEEIRERVAETFEDKTIPKAQEQRALQNEATRRRQAGELVPWPEVFVDSRRLNRPRANPRKNVRGNARVITPKLLGGEQVLMEGYDDPRQPLFEWLRDPQNPYLARSIVNRVWANYFHRGIIEPTDDMNLANPPSNAELLEYLARGFVANGYDLKWLHREILNSDTYQRSWRPNESNRHDEKHFSRAVLRRLPAEVVVDAIAMATATREQNAKFAKSIEQRAIGPAGNGAYSGPGGGNRRGTSNYALTIFGKPERTVNCDCERTMSPTLLQTLYTRNDPELLAQIEGGRRGQASWIAELRREYRRESRARSNREVASIDAAGAPQQQIRSDAEPLIEEAFLRTVSRHPTAAEMERALADVAAATDPIDGIRDLLWALLNTREFLVNH